MKCPFCGKEMQQGTLSGDGRSALCWETDKKLGFFDRLGGKGTVETERTVWGKFRIQGEYCPACEKLIFSARIRT